MRAGGQEGGGQKREEVQDCRSMTFKITKICCFREIVFFELKWVEGESKAWVASQYDQQICICRWDQGPCP